MKATEYSELETDLSSLSEALAGRLESEDELITLYMSATHTLPLTPKKSIQSF
jgi:regulator of sigma D